MVYHRRKGFVSKSFRGVSPYLHLCMRFSGMSMALVGLYLVQSMQHSLCKVFYGIARAEEEKISGSNRFSLYPWANYKILLDVVLEEGVNQRSMHWGTYFLWKP